MKAVRPIYVEIPVRASMDALWAKTQEPEQHERWDIRFSTIEYLPRPDESQPQRFLYETRIGFGLKIAGEGETVGTCERNGGMRTSALKFWSDDAKSLIETGSGYWKYIPENGGVKFLTLYDYKTRFGVIGRFFDGILFRPIMTWATAWSFDCLRLWIEEGKDHGGIRLDVSRLGSETNRPTSRRSVAVAERRVRQRCLDGSLRGRHFGNVDQSCDNRVLEK
jgi:hypothetical protein